MKNMKISDKVKKGLSEIIFKNAMSVSNEAENTCLIWFLDEIDMPKELIDEKINK